MADSVLYLVRHAPGRGGGWRESVDMALTGAAFGVTTLVWFEAAPLKVLARRADHGDLLAELTGFGVRCVARRDDLPAGLDGIEGLDDSALHGLRHSAAQLVIL
ncbi:MAG: hypothetical protein ABJQ98_10420 [Alloalcanivorax venustensis]|uniref:hypothetical protein n=1 Tax=Alloalcanivorax venustensis TaxID=172371 RepID=UPI000C61762E|nr:hypothetical protein [Alcanivorax sp.]MCH9783607.1 hypothetical protein [Gammaproteobacteria bacterium]NQY84405.1 hypothetical protein [Alcanivorax sp.]QVL41616.1 MAG: hypothetical protein KFB92_08830 [Alcanivorax sp.]